MSEVFFSKKPIGAIEHPDSRFSYKAKDGTYKTLYFKDYKTARNVHKWAKEEAKMFVTPIEDINPLSKGQYDMAALEWVEKSKAKKVAPSKAKTLLFKGARLKKGASLATAPAMSKWQPNPFSVWTPPANLGKKKKSKKKLTGFDISNPWIATGIVAVGSYFLAKKAKLI